ncbi:acyl-CoA N-acyltransferase [Lentinula raphanica]|uniref:Acyl-CoA N-acyltransferase n=1 Tax=Lentinula raphanica TaxID=153919 RepID=A0AA38P2Q4_9AGAR|nr:acyl-CoA N-acyltransferase [Lentinula raphanica]KAJ3835222.1 acyl-CoA N-acyltransferase [Lentinula raphanica]KAJ3971509.1 acyl-CoA N-acyltransferase [Lentinula raphanica]
MTITIRKALDTDAPTLSRICLLTADAGSTAEALHDFGELPGLVYAVPYVKVPTTWGFVMVDDLRDNEVVGYIVGSTDTRAFESYTAEHWWPQLAEKYPPSMAGKEADARYMNLFRNMFKASDACVAFSPAHMHINILPEYHQQGWGRKLLSSAVKFLKGEGLSGVWLGLDPRNSGARAFYERVGFRHVDGFPDNYMGLKFGEDVEVS